MGPRIETPRKQTPPPDGASERQHAIETFERGDFALAARALVSLLARSAPEPTLLRLCGMALTRSGAVQQGLPYLARARRLAPRDPLAALWHGIALHTATRYSDAATALHDAGALAPSDPAPLVHLARACLKLGRPQDALAAAGQAAALQPALLEAQHALRLAQIAVLTAGPADTPNLAQAWLDLGQVCLRLGHVADARAAMHQAVALRPEHAAAAAELAMLDHLRGEPLTAIARLRELVAQAPGCEIARLHLANRLILDGDAAAGLALLTAVPQAATLRPHWRAHRVDALIRLGRHDQAQDELAQANEPPGDAEILLCWQAFLLQRQAGRAAAALATRVAALAGDRNAAPPEPRLRAHFALADFHHAQGRRAQAFAHWQDGHRLLRLAQPFSRASHAALIGTTRQHFDRNRLAHGPRAASTDPAPIFIVGLPRTGTTLTEHILAAHPAVHGAGERLAIRETLRALTGTDDAHAAVGRAAALEAPALSQAASHYLAALHALAPDARRILDKLPDNFYQLGFIATLLPGARILCCTRDLRDVGASIFRQGFIGHHPYAHDLGDLGWTMARHRELLAHWRGALTLPMLEIDHADWVGDFDRTLRRVLEFLDLPYDCACTRFYEQDRAVITASREQVNQPINARGIGQWRDYATQLAPMLRELDMP